MLKELNPVIHVDDPICGLRGKIACHVMIGRQSRPFVDNPLNRRQESGCEATATFAIIEPTHVLAEDLKDLDVGSCFFLLLRLYPLNGLLQHC